jgi:hypothetical protein
MAMMMILTRMMTLSMTWSLTNIIDMDLVQDVHDPLQVDDSNHSNSESENEFEPDSPPC